MKTPLKLLLCHHGSSGARSSQGISGAAMQSVGTGLIAVFVIDVAFALLLYVLR